MNLVSVKHITSPPGRRIRRSDLLISLRDLFSFEFLFVCFCTAATFKSLPGLSVVGDRFDLTLLTALLSGLVGLMMFLRDPVLPDSKLLIYLYVYLWLVCWMLLSYTLWGDRAIEVPVTGRGYSGSAFYLLGKEAYVHRKIQQVLVFNTWGLVAVLFFISREHQVMRFLRILLSTIFIVSLYSAMQGIQSGRLTAVTLFGLVDVQQALGIMSGIGIVVSAAGMIIEWERRIQTLLLSIVCVLCSVTTWLSGTRQGILGSIVAIIFLGLLIIRSRERRGRVLRLFVLAMLMVVTGYILISTLGVENEWASSRIMKVMTGQYGEDSRIPIWQAAWRMCLREPILGFGPGSFAVVTGLGDEWCHNIFLEFWSELGLPGLLLGGFLLAVPLRCLLGYKRKELTLACGITGAVWMYLFVCSLVSGDFPGYRMLFIFSGLVIAVPVMERARQRNHQRSVDRWGLQRHAGATRSLACAQYERLVRGEGKD